VFLFITTSAGAWAHNTPPYDVDTPGGYPPYDPADLAGGGPNWTGYDHIADARIKTFVCPSDNAQDITISPTRGGVLDGLFFYLYNSQLYFGYDSVWDWPSFGHELGAANYLGCSGYAGTYLSPQYAGVYYPNSKTKLDHGLRLARVPDGKANQ
jgi:hypothetical protein